MYKVYKNSTGLRVKLPESIYEEVQKCIEKFYPNECGGIFVGTIDNGNTAVISEMMLPKKFRSTPIYFVRVADLLNKWLEKIFQRDGGNTIYLGEWHSHPNGSPYPSNTDLKAMEDIANNNDVRISTPLLLIVAYNGEVYKEKIYIYQENNLKPYTYENE